MKTTLTIITLALSLFATASFAAPAGTKVEKSKIIVKSQNKNAIATSKGKKSVASVGSVTAQGSKIKKSTIIVKSQNKNATATAVGKKSVASVGSV
ncbi:MAG: hypothetical protein KAG10_00680, partial [Methylococcales bacterium]|nr:hypothetical protein [Methylococcales bacterium]